MSDTTFSGTMHLPVGSMLGEYCITGVIGQGGFSTVYLAYEASLDRTIAIKEFFPTMLAQRSTGHSVAVVSLSNQPVFQAGLESFLREAKLQAKFFHPALVEVIRVWEQNSSAYIAMRYHRGQNLRDLKRSGADLSSEQILNFVKPIFDALALLHSNDVIHRDVSPDNILIRETGEPVLLDLGAARTVVAGMTQALTTVLKPGYAPIEQYADDGTLEQGPWTDVYGLAAVVYFLYVGNAPPQAVTRIVSDSLDRGELMAPVPSALRPVLKRALAVFPENRYRSIAEFRSALIQATDASTASGASPAANDHGTAFANAFVGDDQGDSTVVLPARALQIATVNTNNSARSAPSTSTSTSTLSATATDPPLPLRPPQAQPNPLAAAAQSEPQRTPTLFSSATTVARTASTPQGKQMLKYGTAALALVAAASIWIWTSRSPPDVSPGAVSIVQSSVPPAERSTNVTTPKPSGDPGAEPSPLAPVSVPKIVDNVALPKAAKPPQIERLPTSAPPAPAKPNVASNLLPPTQSPPADSRVKSQTPPPLPVNVPRQLVANEPSVAAAKPAIAKADPLPPASSVVAPVVVPLPTPSQSDESSAWNRAMNSRSEFDLMAYLGKYPTGAHADDARKSLPKAQRTTEGCLLRYPAVRTFAWSGKCSEGMAVGLGVLKWVTQTDSVSAIEGRGILNNGIMVGRWTFDVSPTLPGPRTVVNRTIDFDNLGNVSRLQRYNHKDGGYFVGETNASMENYFGASNGAGTYTRANGDEYRGQFMNGTRHGIGVYTYKDNARFKRLTGSWVEDRVQGQGTLELADGSAFTGTFLGGRSGFDGIVKKLRADGSVAETQVWRDGKPEGSDVSPIKGF